MTDTNSSTRAQAEEERIRVQAEDFDPGAETAWLHEQDRRAGAVATFLGLVRDDAQDPLTSLFLEHYPGMTEKALGAIVDQARTRWPLGRVVLLHRVGELAPGDSIVFVGVASAHREAAFAACEFLMDYLKREAPFWKKEKRASGEHWVEQKGSDLERAGRWG